MGLEITRREVLNNLIRFKDNLLEMRSDKKLRHDEGDRVYKVLMNRKTGDMRFAQKIQSLEPHLPRNSAQKSELAEWKEVRIIVGRKEGVHFDVVDAENHVLKPSDLDPLAWRIAKETMDVLNQKGKEVSGRDTSILPEEVVLHDLSSIHLSVQAEQLEDLPGWVGHVGRVEAER